MPCLSRADRVAHRGSRKGKCELGQLCTAFPDASSSLGILERPFGSLFAESFVAVGEESFGLLCERCQTVRNLQALPWVKTYLVHTTTRFRLRALCELVGLKKTQSVTIGQATNADTWSFTYGKLGDQLRHSDEKLVDTDLLRRFVDSVESRLFVEPTWKIVGRAHTKRSQIFTQSGNTYCEALCGVRERFAEFRQDYTTTCTKSIFYTKVGQPTAPFAIVIAGLQLSLRMLKGEHQQRQTPPLTLKRGWKIFVSSLTCSDRTEENTTRQT